MRESGFFLFFSFVEQLLGVQYMAYVLWCASFHFCSLKNKNFITVGEGIDYLQT